MIISAILLTLLNLFDKIDWKLGDLPIHLKGGYEGQAIGFFSLISSLLISIPLILINEFLFLFTVVVFYIVIDYFVTKKFSGKHNELKHEASKNVLTQYKYRRFLTLIFFSIPIIEIYVLKSVASA